jgi:hypothetical protein
VLATDSGGITSVVHAESKNYRERTLLAAWLRREGRRGA